MYRYYYNSSECLIYLENVPATSSDTGDQVLNAMKSSRWFTRGLTLQELLASKTRHFFAIDWSPIENLAYLNKTIANVTKIDEKVLANRDLSPNSCIAERMCWASRRETTRSEDMAYSLMGIFNVNMPVIYSEGAIKAFRRLQNEIMQTSFDQTIFAWHAEYESSGLLATSPNDFRDTPKLGLWHPSNLSPFVMTKVGLSIRMNMIERGADPEVDGERETVFLSALQCDVKVGSEWKIFMVYLEPVRGANFFLNGEARKAYRRVRCRESLPVEGSALEGWPYQDVLVLQDEHYQLVRWSIMEDLSRR